MAVHGQPFVLRIESPPATIGGGRVIGPSLRRLRRTDQRAIARLERLRSQEPTARLRGALASLGTQAWTERRICAIAGLTAALVESSLASLVASGSLIELPVGPRRTIRVLDESVKALEDRILARPGAGFTRRTRGNQPSRAPGSRLPSLTSTTRRSWPP